MSKILKSLLRMLTPAKSAPARPAPTRATPRPGPAGRHLAYSPNPDGDADPEGRMGAAHALSSTHLAMATELDAEAVRAIAEREGWPVKYSKRGGLFGVMEVWIEGTRMIEILTPEMQAEYRGLTAADADRLPDAAVLREAAA